MITDEGQRVIDAQVARDERYAKSYAAALREQLAQTRIDHAEWVFEVQQIESGNIQGGGLLDAMNAAMGGPAVDMKLATARIRRDVTHNACQLLEQRLGTYLVNDA